MLNKIKITIQNVDVWKNNEVKYQISTKKANKIFCRTEKYTQTRTELLTLTYLINKLKRTRIL